MGLKFSGFARSGKDGRSGEDGRSRAARQVAKNMPITKSAKKALRQNVKRNKSNRTYKNKMKNLLKEMEVLIAEKKTKEAKELLPQVYKILDKSAKKGIIKKNTASRKKGRITKACEARTSINLAEPI